MLHSNFVRSREGDQNINTNFYRLRPNTTCSDHNTTVLVNYRNRMIIESESDFGTSILLPRSISVDLNYKFY